MINFSDLSQAESREFFDSIELVLLDCDGVIWQGGPIPGCGEVINQFLEMGKRVALISNNSLRPLSEFHDKVKEAQVHDFPDSDIIMPTVTVVQYLKTIDFRRKVFALCSPAMLDGLRKAGFHCDDGSTLDSDDLIQQTLLDQDVGAVVIDSDVTFNYMKLSKAVHYLRNPDVLFIAGATDSWYPTKPRVRLLGPGPFVDLVAKASERQPIVLGKPGSGLGKFLATKYSIDDPKKVLFIGDSMEQDIAFAQRQGYRSVLVLTGVSSLEEAQSGLKVGDISALGEPGVEVIRPEFYLDTLANLTTPLDQVNLFCLRKN